MRRFIAVAILIAAGLAGATRSEAKDFEALAIVGSDGGSITLRPASGLIDSFFDFGSPYNAGEKPRRVARRGGYVLLYPLAAGGFPGVPGRFYPATGAACFGWERRGQGLCHRPNATLLRVLRPSLRLKRFRGDAPRIDHLDPGNGNLNVVAAIELALGRQNLSRRARTPLSCLHFQARWAAGHHGARRLCLGWRGVYARGRLYPLGPSPWNLAYASAPAWQRLGSAVELVPLERRRVRLCRKSRLTRPTCPTFVPAVRAAYVAHLAAELARPHPLAVFNLEQGGEHPNEPARNRPPRMAHVLTAGGEVWRAAPVWTIGTRALAMRDGLVRRTRSRTYSFGRVTWAKRTGRLYLASSYPRGGMLGNHLIFRWRNAGTYVVSLHAWEPLTETAATLRAMVASAETT